MNFSSKISQGIQQLKPSFKVKQKSKLSNMCVQVEEQKISTKPLLMAQKNNSQVMAFSVHDGNTMSGIQSQQSNSQIRSKINEQIQNKKKEQLSQIVQQKQKQLSKTDGRGKGIKLSNKIQSNIK